MCCNNNISNGNTLLPYHTGCGYDLQKPDKGKVINNQKLSIHWFDKRTYPNKEIIYIFSLTPCPIILSNLFDRNDTDSLFTLIYNVSIYKQVNVLYTVYVQQKSHWTNPKRPRKKQAWQENSASGFSPNGKMNWNCVRRILFVRTFFLQF